MKKIIATILICATFLMSVPTVMASVYDEGMITLNVVDKNDVPVSNACIKLEYEQPTKNSYYKEGKWNLYGNKYTDRMGKIRLYDMSSLTPAEQLREDVQYGITVTMQRTDGKYTSEKFTRDLNGMKDGDEYTIKLKGEDTKKDVEKAKDRVDIYVKNSKGGAVRNMLVYFAGDSAGVPTGFENYNSYYRTDGIYEGYTDKNGRLTIPNVYADNYEVLFSWRGGSHKKDDIKVTSKSGVKEFVLTFDETLLDK